MQAPVLVTGATGIQGSAVIRGLLALNAETIVHAATRNPESDAAKALLQLGPSVKLFKVDWENVESIKAAAEGCHAAFLNVTIDFTDMSAEARHAANQARACTETPSIRRIVQSSSGAMDLALDDAAWTEYVPNNPHSWMANYLKSKKLCEDAVTSIPSADLAEGWCIVRGCTFLTNFLPPQGSMMYPEMATLQKITTASSPEHKASYFDPNDLGKLSARMLLGSTEDWSARWQNRAVPLARENLTLGEIFSKINAALEKAGSKKKVEIIYVPRGEAEQRAAGGDPFIDSQLFQNKYMAPLDLQRVADAGVDLKAMASADDFFARHKDALVAAVGGS